MYYKFYLFKSNDNKIIMVYEKVQLLINKNSNTFFFKKKKKNIIIFLIIIKIYIFDWLKLQKNHYY